MIKFFLWGGSALFLLYGCVSVASGQWYMMSGHSPSKVWEMHFSKDLVNGFDTSDKNTFDLVYVKVKSLLENADNQDLRFCEVEKGSLNFSTRNNSLWVKVKCSEALHGKKEVDWKKVWLITPANSGDSLLNSTEDVIK